MCVVCVVFVLLGFEFDTTKQQTIPTLGIIGQTSTTTLPQPLLLFAARRRNALLLLFDDVVVVSQSTELKFIAVM